MGKKKGKSASETKGSQHHIGSRSQEALRGKSRTTLDESSSDSDEEKEKKAPPPPPPPPPPKKEKSKKGKKAKEEEIVDPGPGPGMEGVGEAAWMEILRMREAAAAALAERLEEEEGGMQFVKPKKPKKPPKPKGKKQKITSEMLAQMKKEAEEEAARLIEMERLRIEEEKRVALEKEKRETAEQLVRSEQLEKARILREEVKMHNRKINRVEKEGIDWLIYIACGELPNPSIVDHMSTYLHLWEKVMEITTMDTVSKRTTDVMKLIADVEDLIDVFVDEHERTYENWKWLRQLFRDHQHESLDVATYRVLRNVTRNMRRIDIPTADYSFKDDYVRLTLWLRVQLPIPLPNPRRAPKSRIDIDFPNVEISVQFPMSIDGEYMAIRAMYLAYDHWSDLSDTFYVPTIPPQMIADLNEVTKKEWRHKLKYKYKFRERVVKEPSPDDPPGTEVVQEEEKEDFDSDEEIPVVPLRKMDPTPSEYAVAADNLFYADSSAVLRLDLPKDVVNLRKYVILGGVYHLDLLYQPPQPQDFVTMELDVTRLFIPKRLEYVPFYVEYIPPEPFVPPEPTEDDETEYVRPPEEIEAEMKQFEEDMDKLSFVTIKWCPDVLFLEPPFPCHWNDDVKRWSIRDVHDVKHYEERGILTFRTGTFGLFGLATPKFGNLPYQAWDIRPEEEYCTTYALLLLYNATWENISKMFRKV